MKVLITGSTGLLGLALIKSRPAECDIYAGYYNFPQAQLPKTGVSGYMEFDIRQEGQVLAVFDKMAPEVVIHSASIGNVDYCERNQEEAWRTNVDGSRNLIKASRRHKPLFIFMSSNAVFDGGHPPYGEEAAPNPVDYYGRTKFETERDLASSGLRYTVARLMTMYGWHHPLERQNPVTWVLENLKAGKAINVVEDIYNNHLYVENAAQAIWAITLKNKQGIFHIAGSEIVSRYKLALMVSEVFGLDSARISPVKSSFFPSIAPRPKNTSYSIDKMQKELSVPGMGIRQGLELMKADFPRGWSYGWWR